MTHPVTTLFAAVRPVRLFAVALYAAAAACLACVAAVSASAQDAEIVAETIVASGEFSRKRKGTSGAWSIVETEAGRTLRIAEDFRTGRGPDIKVFLSPTTLDASNGANATEGSVLLGQLDSRRGAASFAIPAELDLSQFASVLIHCEEFSVLFGGSSL